MYFINIPLSPLTSCLARKAAAERSTRRRPLVVAQEGGARLVNHALMMNLRDGSCTGVNDDP
jgi:hypothetical protein